MTNENETARNFTKERLFMIGYHVQVHSIPVLSYKYQLKKMFCQSLTHIFQNSFGTWKTIKVYHIFHIKHIYNGTKLVSGSPVPTGRGAMMWRILGNEKINIKVL